MPGKHGMEVLEEIRSRADVGRICVVMLTATDDPDVIVGTYAYKPNAYLRKMNTDPKTLYVTLARELSNENPQMFRPIRVFLCHSHVDKPAVRELYYRLKRDLVEPWLDEKELIPGQDWELEIRKAVKASDIVAVCLSHQASRPGFLQKEIRYVLDAADEQPEGAIFVIPLLLEPCDVPTRLTRWQWIDFATQDGYEQLMRSVRARTKELGVG
jgi:CheY-like chemotaxis protein